MEPGSESRQEPRPETVAKLNLIYRCRKRELGARLRIEIKNETIEPTKPDLIDMFPKRELGARFRIETRT